MMVSIRLTEEDFDLKKLFDDIEHSSKSLDDIVNGALSAYIENQNIIFGHIDLSRCGNFNNRDVSVEVMSPYHRTYLKKIVVIQTVLTLLKLHYEKCTSLSMMWMNLKK